MTQLATSLHKPLSAMHARSEKNIPYTHKVLMLQSLLATPPQLLASGAHEGPRLLARMSRSAACQLARAGRGSIGSAKVEAGTAGAMSPRAVCRHNRQAKSARAGTKGR